MDNEKIVKCIIDLERIYFPKRCSYIQGGQFAIFMANVHTPISGCEDIYNNIKLKGTTCEINYGEKYKVTCKLAESSEKYGDTYEIIYINRLVDLKDKVKQRNFLMSILNENVVDRLYATYHDVIELLENEDIKSLTKVKGIGTTTALRLIQKYKNCKDFSEIYTELGHIGFSSNMIKKLVEYYKSPDLVIDQVKSNPYDLVNIDGIGFKKADEIAEKLGIKGSNPNRVKGCILYILSQNGINGKSYLHYSELMKILYDNIGYIEQDIINKVAFDLIADKEVYVSEDGEYIGLNIYRQLEENIAKELIRLLNAEDSRVKINDIETIISNTEQIQGFEFTQEQRDAIYLFSENNVVAITGGAGCVDCDTEYFNGFEWKRISDYVKNDRVLQYNTDGTTNLVYPTRYIKQEQDYLWEIKTKYGINQCLSDNHNVVYETSKGNLYKNTFKNIKEMHEKSANGFSGKFYTTFKYNGEGINLSEYEIRLMCAVICDGYFSNKYHNKNTCNINIKKDRKKRRLENILNELNIDYHTVKSEIGYTKYVFVAPLKTKEFDSYWYKCNSYQLSIITDEILHWDGSVSNNRLFFSTCNKNTADFIQFAFASQNKRCKLSECDRVGEQRGDYIRKSKEYNLYISDRIKPTIGGFHKDNPNKTKIHKYKTKDGYEYCFTVDSGMLVLRRYGNIFITGNCGKSSVAKGMSDLISKYIKYGTALSGKASVRIKEATEMESKTIHKLLGYQHGEFYYNSQNQLDCDAIFIDESTMISGELFLSLLKAIPSGAKVVLIGDIQQLTPIGSCQVFSDVLNSNIPSFKLTKPHRQAMRSGIIPLSLNIINQKHIFDSTFEGNIILGELQDMELDIYKSFINGSDIVVNHFLKQYKKTNDLMETQIIVPLKNRGDVCTYKLNVEVQSKINPISDSRKHILINLDKERFYQIQIGDKVINTKNNYKATTVDGEDIAVFNGNMGIVKNIDDEFVTVDFVGLGEVILDSNGVKSLELGYAITVHKSQGSGFDTVIGAIDSSAYVMLNAELLYTLVTRAKKYCVLVGKNSAIRSAITKREIKNKQTYLTELLR